MPKTRIFIVDDHQVVLEGVRAALGRHHDIEIVGEATDSRTALKQIESTRPDVVIMDISMPNINGIEATLQIKKMDPRIKVIIFTMYSYREFLWPLTKAGISSYVLKQKSISDLYTAIQAVQKGGAYFSEEIHEFMAENLDKLMLRREMRDPFDLLSAREREIFQLLAEGRTITEAADLLCISNKTVETHKAHIMAKLKIRSMAEWAKEAIRRGIITL